MRGSQDRFQESAHFHKPQFEGSHSCMHAYINYMHAYLRTYMHKQNILVGEELVMLRMWEAKANSSHDLLVMLRVLE